MATVTDITPYMELREKLEQQNRTQREALENANHNLLRMMQQMEEQKAQFAQTAARNMEKEQRYRQRLNRDALTGTYNRRYYEEVVRNNIGPSCIALMDIDDLRSATIPTATTPEIWRWKLLQRPSAPASGKQIC